MKERVGDHQHSTAKEDGNAKNATMAVTDGCGPIDNPQEISIGDEAGNPPQDEGDGSDRSSYNTKSVKSVENPNSNVLQHSSVMSAVTACIT
eukprot:1004967-Ditylum_brightwellii.AAC.1